MKRRPSNIIATQLLTSAIALAVLLPSGCNTLDSPYEDAERLANAVAGRNAPEVDALAKQEPLLAECVSFYLDSEAADYFESQVGDPSMPGELHCGDDPIWYLDQTWNCEVFGVDYTVVRFSRESELPFETRRTVIPSKGEPWSFQCKYDSECIKIKCKRI